MGMGMLEEDLCARMEKGVGNHGFYGMSSIAISPNS